LIILVGQPSAEPVDSRQGTGGAFPNPMLTSPVAEGTSLSSVRHQGRADDKADVNPNNAIEAVIQTR
jgi:hypothetical protein